MRRSSQRTAALVAPRVALEVADAEAECLFDAEPTELARGDLGAATW
jgi:hypothetical protein